MVSFLITKLCLCSNIVSVVYCCRDTRNHENSKQEWSDEELKKLYETHERLLDLVSLFCFVPRAKYLPLGPTRYQIIYFLTFISSSYFYHSIFFLLWG